MTLMPLMRPATGSSRCSGKIPGVVDLQFKRQSGTPAIAIQLRPDALLASGLKAQDVLDTIETAYTGTQVGQTFSGTRTVDAVVLLPEALRHQPGGLAQLMISGPLGPVPLSQVARILVTQDRYSIEHDGGQRRISVTFNVNGASLAERRAAGRTRRLQQRWHCPPASIRNSPGLRRRRARRAIN